MTRILLFFLIVFSSITFSSIFQSKKNKNKALFEPKLLDQKPEPLFALDKEAYENLGEGILGSKSHRVKKNLEAFLILLGSNLRPDSKPPCYFCSYKGKALKFNEKERYSLSEITGDAFDEASGCDVEFAHSAKGALLHIQENASLSFSLELKSQPTLHSSQIGEFKLDPYLLVRQKGTWSGRDLFLENYGGEEFAKYKEAERLDFMHLQKSYSLFAKEKSLFSWKEGRWQEAAGDSADYPLMQIEKISPKSIEIFIWDVSGMQKEKIILPQTSPSKAFKKELPLRYIGAKSAHKWLFKTDKERMILEEGDWILFSNGRWSKLSTALEIDQYVSKVGVGELFIVKALKDQNGKKRLVGDLFNSSRTELVNLSLDVSRASKSK